MIKVAPLIDDEKVIGYLVRERDDRFINAH